MSAIGRKPTGVVHGSAARVEPRDPTAWPVRMTGAASPT